MSEMNEVYTEINIDFDLPPARREAVWELYKEFKKYRFSQRQIQMLLKLISSELENEVAVELIHKILKAIRPYSPLALEDEENIKNEISNLILSLEDETD